jgi:hypothetical protein
MSGPYQIDDSLALDFPSSTHYSYSLMVVQGNQTLRYRVLESVVSIHTCTFTSGGVSTDAMRCEQNLLPLSVRSVHPVTLLEDLAHVAVGVLLGSALYSFSSGRRTMYSSTGPNVHPQYRSSSDLSPSLPIWSELRYLPRFHRVVEWVERGGWTCRSHCRYTGLRIPRAHPGRPTRPGPAHWRSARRSWGISTMNRALAHVNAACPTAASASKSVVRNCLFLCGSYSTIGASMADPKPGFRDDRQRNQSRQEREPHRRPIHVVPQGRIEEVGSHVA